MSRGAIIALVIVGVIVLIGLSVFGWAFGTYNKLVSSDETVKQSCRCTHAPQAPVIPASSRI